MEQRLVGTSVPRREAAAKLTGTAEYVDDIALPGMLHGITVRSTVPRALIRRIQFQDGIPWREFTIVQAADIPGRNIVSLIVDDQPYLAEQAINHSQEPILLLAHPDKEMLERARRHVVVEYDLQPAVFDMDESLRANTVIWGPDNVFKRYQITKGDVDSVWNQAALVLEGEYTTGAQEQLYIETNGMLAEFQAGTGLTVRGSMQCPFYVQKALMGLFSLPAEQVRVIQQETGGAFGGKEEYPSMLAGHAALLAWKSGRPVKMIYDREEDMAATTKRHPSRTRHRTALDADGHVLAMDIEFVIDGGAYATLSGVVLSRGTIHAAGPYRCPNIRVRSTAVATNLPPFGAFRGFGAPQILFALERHMDKLAQAAGLDPEAFRALNLLRPGDTTATGQTIRENIDLPALQHRALKLADYRAKQNQFAEWNRSNRGKRGIGFATFFHGAGFTGSGERFLNSVVRVRADARGQATVLTSMTEMGQGTNTILTQIAAEALGVPCDCVEIKRPDTSEVPNSGPTVASRTAMVVGKLVERAAVELRRMLPPYSGETFSEVCRGHIPPGESLETTARYQEPPGVFWDDENYRGEAYGAFSYATYVAEVEVDLLTGAASVLHFVALQEVGRVLNPVLATGQIEGGVAQGIGFALYEKVEWKGGVMANNQMTNYIVPTAMDVPLMQVHFEEIPYQHGAMGAKGIGELPMDGPAPAILNAISQALGTSFDHIPLLPEDILARCSTGRVPEIAA